MRWKRWPKRKGRANKFADGANELTANSLCPPIEQGVENVVTGTFRHGSVSVVDLLVERESKPIGVTTTHPYWSVDQENFVPAGELKTGEKLLGRDGSTLRVVSASPRSGRHDVYHQGSSRARLPCRR